MQTHARAPVLDYLLATHRASGRIHVDVSHGLDAFMQHVMRLANERTLPRPEALVACNRAINMTLGLPQITEARRDAR